MTPLRNLVKEVRQQIIEHCLVTHLSSEPYHQDTSYTTPPLLIALRGEKDLYEEALYVFYKINTFYYRHSIRHSKGFCEMDSKQLGGWKNLRHLGLDLDFDYPAVRTNPNLADDFIFFISETTTSKIPTFGSQVANDLETIDINSTSRGDFYSLLCLLSPYLTKLKRLSVNTRTIGEVDYDFRYVKCMSLLVKISHLFGVKCRRELVPHDVWTVERFVWEAKEGEVLKRSEYFCQELHDGPCERKAVDKGQ